MLSQEQVGCQIGRGPPRAQGGCVRAQLDKQVAQLPTLALVNWFDHGVESRLPLN
jgi:hypothetical protein